MKVTKLVHLFILLFAVTTTNAFARIGETQTDVEKRLGPSKPLSTRQERNFYPINKLPPDSPQCRSVAFEYQNFLVIVSFFDGKSSSEMYLPLTGSPITEEQRVQLMANNSNGHQWDVNAPDVWLLGDEHVRAFLIHEPPGLWIVTEPFLEYKMAQDKKGLQGM